MYMHVVVHLVAFRPCVSGDLLKKRSKFTPEKVQCDQENSFCMLFATKYKTKLITMAP